jgi:alkanesulfonate monooxygenase SsuD/methylene tetrahydromethanopterin reductase-like flavin-dependent oxidoreductase (luciferase family)
VSEPPIRFGLFLSQASKSLGQVQDEFGLAEELGFDVAYLVDHLLDTDGSPDLPCLESWTLLAGLATMTRRIRLGVLVTSNTFRHPAVLLKSAVTVDHLSAGRLILGLGTGWHGDEHRRYGIPFPSRGERVDRLEEALEVITRLMAGGPVSYAGRHYRLDEAFLEPRPVQQPRIPILVAAHRPRMLRIAARYADQWDTFAELPGASTEGVTSGVAEQLAALDEACTAVGRDPATIRRSTWVGREVWRSQDAYVGFVRRMRLTGFTDLTTVMPAPEDVSLLRRVAADVLPALRAEAVA